MLRAKVEQHALRDCLVTKVDGGPQVVPIDRVDGSRGRRPPVCSRREPLRPCTCLTGVGRFVESVGINGSNVAL